MIATQQSIEERGESYALSTAATDTKHITAHEVLKII
jgi:hypothetical protein